MRGFLPSPHPYPAMPAQVIWEEANVVIEMAQLGRHSLLNGLARP